MPRKSANQDRGIGLFFLNTTSVSNPNPSTPRIWTTSDPLNISTNGLTLYKSLAEYLSDRLDSATCNTHTPPGFNVRSISATNLSGYSAWSNTLENSKSKVSLSKGWLWKSPLITSGGLGTKSIPTESDTPIRLRASTSWPTLAPIQSAFDSLERSRFCFKSWKNIAKTWIFRSQSRVVHSSLSLGLRVFLSCRCM